MTDQPRYATLQDYVRVLRRHRLLILVLGVFGAIAALAFSLSQSTEYEASADVSFRDVLADLDFFSGDDSPPELTPLTRATINAQTLTRPEITTRVRRKLDTDLSASELAASIATKVDAQTNLVQITATSGDAEFSSDLANAYAETAFKVGTRAELSRIGEFADTVQEELQLARKDLPQSAFEVGTLTTQLSRLRLLEDTAQPVQVSRQATPPSDPVSPRPVRNTVLGALIGLLVGLLAAFVRDSLDRRVRSDHDVHHELGKPIVGRVSDKAFGYHGLIRSNGLVMRPEDFEAFRVLRTNLAALKEGGPRSVLVTSASPGEGKSTVSMALASAAAVAGQSVLLIEADLRRPCFSRRLGIREIPGLTDYLLGNVAPKDILQVVQLAEPPVMNGQAMTKGQSEDGASIVCITAGSPNARAAELLSGKRFDDLLSKVARAYDLVVLDTSPLLAVVDPLTLASKVDAILLCVRADQATRDQVRAAREALGHLPSGGTGAVVTGLRQQDPDGYGYYYGY